MEQKEILTLEEIKQLIKKYLVDNLKVSLKVERGYYATDSAHLNILITVEDEIIADISEQL